jgi:GntR family transcriptional regulator/MocR family aminotransferase
MARQLGVARNTVLAATEQLAAEGFLVARQGAGTVVAGEISAELTKAARTRGDAAPRSHTLSRAGERLAAIRRDAPGGEAPRAFLPSIPDLGAFPHELWGRLLRRACNLLAPDQAAYGSTAGLPALRKALCTHLCEARGVSAEPEQIIVTPSAQAALDLLARALVDQGDTVWIEEPGYLGARAAFAGVGAEIVPVSVDEQGLDPREAAAAPAMVYVTPSHQYPTGKLMPPARRLELLDCADRHNAYIVEDDFDSEFQFQGRPVAALQGLDAKERVLYVGTFSKVLQPGIRVGYAVVPRDLAEPLVRIQRNTGQVVPAIVQLALAAFIEEGHLRAHIRRMCALYHERQSLLAAALEEHCSAKVSVERPAGGMQLIAGLPEDIDDAALAVALGRRGVQARPLSAFYLGKPARRGLLLGFAGYPPADIERGVRQLATALEG